jgi:bifunctional non-homologous end joining protein LigD
VALDSKGVSSFQLLQAFEMGQERPAICYYVFDLLRWKGKDLQGQALAKRKSQLEKLLSQKSGPVRFSASLGEDPGPLLKQAQKLGLEGLIGKRKDSVYEAGRRSGSWIKLKLHREQEFVIGGFTNPEGTRQHFGALLLGFTIKVICSSAAKSAQDSTINCWKISRIVSLDSPVIPVPLLICRKSAPDGMARA